VLPILGPKFPLFFELFYQFIVALALRFQADGSSCLGDRHIVYGDEEIILWHYLQPLVCPFNHTDSITIKVILQPEVGNFLNAIETIKINVVQGKSAMILSKYDERGTEGILFDVQAASDALD
jgi:hypothetical protein